ncbi:MAG: sensor histidine kinase [Cyanobacteria bacterium SBLK]|nr:sensor histidine kinase [Cyanobacteria bacterium SBLK]
MFLATRRRLAIWYATVTAVLLLVFATGFYFYVRNTLIDRVDDTLKHVTEVVERSLVIQSQPAPKGGDRVDIAASFRNNTQTGEEDRIDLEWFDPQGHLLWSTFTVPPSIPLQLSGRAITVHISPTYLLRQVTKRIERGRYVLGYLRVSHPWFEVTKPSRKLIYDLILGTSLTVASVAAIGWLLSGLAIEPIKESYQNLEQFTADASHELRNPIATIQTNVQMALSYPDRDPKVRQIQLQAIERLTQRLGKLVNDLLFLTRSQRGISQDRFQSLPLDALLMEAIEEQRFVAEQEGVLLFLRIIEPEKRENLLEEETFNVSGNWDSLARLFTNLTSNAIEYSRGDRLNSDTEKAKVEIKLQRVKKDRRDWLQVKVKDTGKGIPQKDLPYIFDRFYRVDPARTRDRNASQPTGSGLGLAIAKAIVENHAGQIKVESQLNLGTTFIVLLPVAKNES